jgi:hypothetical protein
VGEILLGFEQNDHSNIKWCTLTTMDGREIDLIEIYPCIAYRLRLWAEREDGMVRRVHAPKPPLVRDQIIAKRCDHLITGAAP